jgi:aspartate racemase
MPCNTAHHWADALLDGCPVPFVHIVDAVAAQLPPDAKRLGIVATRATLQARVFDARLAARGIALAAPDEATYDRAVQPAIEAVKRGATREAGATLEPVVAALLDAGADAVVLACTELPIALDAIASPLRARCIDSTDALARACVRRWNERRA